MAALLLAWLHHHPADLKLAIEKATTGLQSVLVDTAAACGAHVLKAPRTSEVGCTNILAPRQVYIGCVQNYVGTAGGAGWYPKVLKASLLPPAAIQFLAFLTMPRYQVINSLLRCTQICAARELRLVQNQAKLAEPQLYVNGPQAGEVSRQLECSVLGGK